MREKILVPAGEGQFAICEVVCVVTKDELVNMAQAVDPPPVEEEEKEE